MRKIGCWMMKVMKMSLWKSKGCFIDRDRDRSIDSCKFFIRIKAFN